MSRLTDAQPFRAVLLSYRAAGMPVATIARLHGIPAHTVNSALYRSKRMRATTVRRAMRKMGIQHA